MSTRALLAALAGLAMLGCWRGDEPRTDERVSRSRVSVSSSTVNSFAAGLLIVPMDTTYQDRGLLRAFGLVYELLRHGVSVSCAWRCGFSFAAAEATFAHPNTGFRCCLY